MVADRLAALEPQYAVDPADIKPALGEQRLQFAHFILAQAGDLLAHAGIVGRRAGQPCRVVGRGQRVDQRVVPLGVDLEIIEGEEGRAEAAHRQHQRRRHGIGLQRLAVGARHAPLRPLRSRMLDREVGLLPRQVLRDAHLLDPGLAALPAEMLQIVCGRGEHVGHALDQVAPPVAVIVDGAAVILRRHHLGLAELARPRADHLLRTQVAALDHAQCVEQARAEQLRPAAVIGERRQRRQHVLLAGAGAEVAFQAPERDDHRRRHAEILLDALEQIVMLLDQLAALLKAVGRDQLLGEVEEVLREEPLAAVDIDDALLEFQVRRGGGDGRGGNLACGGLALELGQPLVEVRSVAAIAAGRRPRLAPPPCIKATKGRARSDTSPRMSVASSRPLLLNRHCSPGMSRRRKLPTCFGVSSQQTLLALPQLAYLSAIFAGPAKSRRWPGKSVRNGMFPTTS